MRFPIAIALLLAGCVGVTDNATVANADSAPADCGAQCPVIFHEVTSWGRQVYRSELEPDGSFLAERLDFNSGEVTETTRRELGVEGYRAAYAALKPLENAENRSIYCKGAPTDGPYGAYTWDEGNRISIYYGCYGVDPSLDPLADAEEAYTAIVNPDGG